MEFGLTRMLEGVVTNYYVESLTESLRETHGLVRHKIKIAIDCAKAGYDAGASHRQFNEFMLSLSWDGS